MDSMKYIKNQDELRCSGRISSYCSYDVYHLLPGGTIEPDYRTFRRVDIYFCTGTQYSLYLYTAFLQLPAFLHLK
jgi:hypothetical protein